MKLNHTPNGLTFIPEDDEDKVLLIFMEDLYKNNMLIELIGFFTELFEKGVLRAQDGKFIISDDWALSEDVPGYV